MIPHVREEDREFLESLLRMARTRVEAAERIGEALGMSARSLTGLKGKKVKSGKLKTVGVGLLLIPDPLVVTYLAGLALLGAGEAYEKFFSRDGIDDLFREAKRLKREMDDVSI